MAACGSLQAPGARLWARFEAELPTYRQAVSGFSGELAFLNLDC